MVHGVEKVCNAVVADLGCSDLQHVAGGGGRTAFRIFHPILDALNRTGLKLVGLEMGTFGPGSGSWILSLRLVANSSCT